jgi:hypothetical protein
MITAGYNHVKKKNTGSSNSEFKKMTIQPKKVERIWGGAPDFSSRQGS